ncbi:TetR/AcrR family transcriptional regulator [Plantactinospora soyae]|uniref:AcrR family transcriptional regulator n=1 Tax=Plantactinospora soyae TaxID=1544732 RepID=A0A927M6Y7_9ACTN|nr:TetR/AcrR family transcriptional regulator [Plantactinospora soyae]MBE1487746.1 AcrR family transcriptional regulator [Plantactinospora soyae]
MTTPATRRRAPGMTPEQRREMVLQAALPLVAEFGSAVTTQQIARAAGIGEATIFRVFADKEELLAACIARALDPTTVLQELRSISVEQPLADRLVEAAEALSGYLNRMGTVLGALHASGYQSHRPPSGEQTAADGTRNRSTDRDSSTGRSIGRDRSQAETREAIAELFEPERATLRLPPDRLAEIFLNFLFGRGRPPAQGQPQVVVEELVDLFLHGALNGAEKSRS